jgi:hypothetical protein
MLNTIIAHIGSPSIIIEQIERYILACILTQRLVTTVPQPHTCQNAHNSTVNGGHMYQATQSKSDPLSVESYSG